MSCLSLVNKFVEPHLGATVITQEKSEILENTKCYKNTEVAELFCVVYNIFADASAPRHN